MFYNRQTIFIYACNALLQIEKATMTPKTATVGLNPLEIRQSLDLSQERMSYLLHVSAKTLGRWEKRETLPSAEAKQCLAKLKEVAELAQMVYSSEGVSEFITTLMPAFDGYTALDLIRLGQHDKVIAQLVADYEGLGY